MLAPPNRRSFEVFAEWHTHTLADSKLTHCSVRRADVSLTTLHCSQLSDPHGTLRVMDAERNPDYLRQLADAVGAFKAALKGFLALHVENTGPMALARGLAPAIMQKDGVDASEVERLRSEVALASGRIASVAPLVGMYIQVQGLGRVDPFAAWLSITQPKPLLEPANILDACDQAIGRLEGMADKAQAELPPTIGVTSMHPLIWGAAGPLWRDGHYREAVAAAAEALVSQVKVRTRRNDVAETALWQEVFSNREPSPGKPRLRWPGTQSDRTVTSMNDGLRQFAPGSQLTIRNTAAHGTESMSEQDGLERLAVLSLLARWVAECELHEV